MKIRCLLQKEFEIYFEKINGLLRSFFEINRKIRKKSQSPGKHLEKVRQNCKRVHASTLSHFDTSGGPICVVLSQG